MSDKSVSMDSIMRNKRSLMRQINSFRREVEVALIQNASQQLAHKIAAHLDSWKESLAELREIINDIFDATDFSGKTQTQINEEEVFLSKDLDESMLAYNAAKGELNAMFARLNKPIELVSRQSLNTSVIGDSSVAHALVKLPDIPVPKFDGKMKNFTEWHSLFAAMIDKNDSLKPVQKLYFLKQAMIGDAANLLKDHTLQEGAYEQAFKYIEERYYNRRALIATHFHDLLEMPAITYSTLRETLDRVNAILRGLKVCKLEVEKMSPLIAYIIVRKLPDRLRTDWENSHLDYSTYPSFEPLAAFLQNRCFSYESVHPDSAQKSTVTKPTLSDDKKKQKTSLATVSKPKYPTPSPRCILCEKGHFLAQCELFLGKSISDRFAFVREKRLCSNCFRQFHSSSVCHSSKCRKCGEAHHTLLHREISTSSNVSPYKSDVKTDTKSDSAAAKPTSVTATTVLTRSMDIVMLPSAVVLVQLNSKFIKARVLIDPCSQVNLVSESFVKKYRLATRSVLSTIEGITPGGENSSLSVWLKLKSRFSNFELEIDATVIGRVPYQISNDALKKVEYLDPDLKLADCQIPYSSVDILIGAQHSSQLLLGNKKFFGSLCLEESRFGWVAQGPLKTHSINNQFCHLTVKIEKNIEKFFEVEEVNPPKPVLGMHERCEAHFLSSYTRLTNGKFQARLPRDKPCSTLANTYRQARAALIRHENNLDLTTRTMYIDFMSEYKNLQHMRLATNFDVPRYFIPHLFVLRPDSTTTAFRTVFNASAKNSSGISLNEALMTGPTLQPELFDIILRFRTYPVAVSADISKMYRQIEIHPDDWPLQSILWRDKPSEPIQIYELTTVTYGTSPASYIATKCLQLLAKEVQLMHPDVAFAITSEFYMDDLLTGADSAESAITKSKLIHSVLESAHFPLRKYVSNSQQLLDTLDDSLIETLQPVAFASYGAAKLLGLQWQPNDDCFSIKTRNTDISNITLTKRVVASLAAQTFDPMGFAAPVIVRAKILLQDLWREGKSWDEPTSPEIEKIFREYHRDVAALPSIKIPRYYSSFTVDSQLIGFCDASTRAYGAAVYLHSKSRSILVCAKSKVAPLKAITIPRLELLGAVLLIQVLDRVCKTLKMDLPSAITFCDSTIVLAWLKGPSDKYQRFVRNRIEFINSKLPFKQWRYVKTNENPADLLTRGISVEMLKGSSMWIDGPTFLSNNTFEGDNISLPDKVPETRNVCNVTTLKFHCDEMLISRYSSFDKLIRIASYMWQFLSRVNSNLSKYEDIDFRTRGLYVVCHISQCVFFPAEIIALKNGNQLPAKSPLGALNPFLDKFDLLRVGGRLDNSSLPYDVRHPIILSRRSKLAELIMRSTHEKYYHASRSFTLAFVQSQFWISGGAAQLIKKVLYQCVWCTRMRGESLTQLMGDLPYERISISRPFTYTGVDFAGPFTIRCTNHRSTKHIKYYAAFFVCFATRAIHIEPVSDLSTNTFIAALQRFSARRGIPQTLWSDNATNFVGTRNVLEQHCKSVGIIWKFIPARSPHHGGLWESAVKAGKKHLVAAANGTVLNAEQFATILCAIESILNSRPLYSKRQVSDPASIDVLTPGHFLVGSHLLHAAPPETSSISLCDRLSFQHQIVRSFWHLWSHSYLAQLQTRSKWKVEASNLQVGDIVLIKDESPPLKWNLARVTGVTPDAQSRVRIVEVESNGSKYMRAIQKLVKLPIEHNSKLV